MYEALSNSTVVLALDDGAFPPCGASLRVASPSGITEVARSCSVHVWRMARRARVLVLTITHTYIRTRVRTSPSRDMRYVRAGARVKVRSTPAHCRFGGVAVAEARLCLDSEGVWSHQPWRGTWRSAPTWRCAPHTSSTACTASDVSSRPRRKWPVSPSSSSWPAPP